jgi:glycosyltransferase involved in cell wall biosynthesis
MKEVLFIAYYFPPIAASGAMRPLGFCRHLEAYGWRPCVLTTTPESVYPPHPVDPHLEAFVPAQVRVEHVGYRDPLSRLIDMRNRVRYSIAARSGSRPDAGMTAQSQPPATEFAKNPGSMLKDAVLDWLFAFPDRQASWVAPAVERIMSLKGQVSPDIVVATGGPWTNFVVGRTLARRFGCPLILDYRDPWTCNPYYAFSAKFLTKKARRLERSMCVTASRVITNTEELRQRLCVEYPGIERKCVAIPNGFDPEILGTHDPATANTQDFVQTGYELCHFGTVYGKRTPGILFRAIWELHQDGVLKPEQLRLRFVGAWESTDEGCNRLAQSLEKQGFLTREPPISHQLCVRQMKRASVLLVVQPESPLQVPGKIYEYIAVGRPLLLVGGEGATAGLVHRHHLGLTCPNELKALKKTLHDLTLGLIPLTPPARDTVNQFNYQWLAKSLADSLDAAVMDATTLDHGHSARNA